MIAVRVFRLLYLIMVRVFGWLVLLGLCCAETLHMA